MSARVTIGICAKNSANTIKATVESIIGQDFPHKFMKVVFVDDGSTDKTLSIVRNMLPKEDIRTLILSSGGKGLGHSRQIVVDNAEGDYLIFVDADVMTKKDFVRNHVLFMDKTPSLGAAAASQTENEKTLVATLQSIDRILGTIVTPHLKKIGAGATIFRLKAIKQVRGFDTDIKGAGEDLDITLRIRQAGWRLRRNSSNEVYHRGEPTTWRQLWNKHFWYGYGDYFLFQKYKIQMLPWEQFPPFPIVIGLKGACTVYKATHKKKAFLLPLHFLFRSIATSLGFIRGYFEGYGPITDES